MVTLLVGLFKHTDKGGIMYKNWKILKSQYSEKAKEYAEVADWCNKNQKYLISENGYYYEVQPIPAPTEDELKARVRAVRDSYLQHYDFTQLPDAPFTEIEKAQYADYRQYLRDYTTLPNWWLENPQTFDEWKKDVDNIL